MCGIVDANVANEVFGHDRPPAGEPVRRRCIDGLAGEAKGRVA